MLGETMGLDVLKKVNSGLKFLYRCGGCLNFKLRKLLCTSLLQSRFDYGCNVYYRGLEKSIKTKLQTSQNKIVRFILGYDNRHRLCVNDFKKVKYLKIDTRIDFMSLNVMFKIYNGIAPSYLCTLKKSSDVHSHNTRNSSMSFELPHVKSQGKKSFMYCAAKSWNNLPSYVKRSSSINSFKSKCKKFLFDKLASIERDDFIYY